MLTKHTYLILVMRWRRGQEELITGLFHWLVPPLLSLVRYKCNPAISPMPNALARYMLEFFTSTLSEAIGNLKERVCNDIFTAYLFKMIVIHLNLNC